MNFMEAYNAIKKGACVISESTGSSMSWSDSAGFAFEPKEIEATDWEILPEKTKPLSELGLIDEHEVMVLDEYSVKKAIQTYVFYIQKIEGLHPSQVGIIRKKAVEIFGVGMIA